MHLLEYFFFGKSRNDQEEHFGALKYFERDAIHQAYEEHISRANNHNNNAGPIGKGEIHINREIKHDQSEQQTSPHNIK